MTEIHTFGCRLNAYESEAIRARTAGASDLVVVNTCSVTGEAVRQAQQTIRRARRERPNARLIVTGCAAQIEPARFERMSEVDLVLGNREKFEAWRYVDASGPRVQAGDVAAMREAEAPIIDRLADRARAFVQVQTGCDHSCTFCIIPFGRGRSRSVPMDAVIAQVQRFCANGYREIVLSGVDLTSYGADLDGQPALGTLVADILERVPALQRLRLSSLDCIEIDDMLLQLIASEHRIMPHLHLSLQSGDDMILKRMKRRHSRAAAVSLCTALREKRQDIAFGADLIAGFPTESEQMFENTLALIDDCGIAFTHVFPFSPRPGTPAARMPQLDRRIIRERARRLREKAEEAKTRHLDRQIGRTKEVLVEHEAQGRCEDYAQIKLDRPAEAGSVLRTRVTGRSGSMLAGVVLA